MLLTFAEVQFLLSLTCAEPELDVMHLLEEPSRDPDVVAAAGLASLVAQGRCAEEDDGEQRVVSLDAALIDVHAALHGAASAVRITTVAPSRTTFWLLLVGPERLVLTPAATGVYHVRAVSSEADLRQQVAAVVFSALVDEPAAGVSITRTGRVDAMSFRTNAELGGESATDDERLAAIDDLVDAVFVNHHPSRG